MNSEDREYETGSYPIPGLLIFINIQFYSNGSERRGAQIDCNEVLESFQSVGFEVLQLSAPSRAELLNELKNIADSDLTKTFSMFAVAVSTHGNEKGFKCGNLEIVEVEELYKIFNNENCPKLANKPKLFFFNFCRGGQELRSVRLENDSHVVVPPTSDMFAVFSTLHKIESLRDIYTGSLFWTALKNVFMGNQSHQDREICKLMTQLNRELLLICRRYWDNQDQNIKLQVIEFQAFGWSKELFLLKKDKSQIYLLKMLPMYHFCSLESDFEIAGCDQMDNYLKNLLPTLLARMHSWKDGPFYPTDDERECLEMFKQMLSKPSKYLIFNKQELEKRVNQRITRQETRRRQMARQNSSPYCRRLNFTMANLISNDDVVAENDDVECEDIYGHRNPIYRHFINDRMPATPEQFESMAWNSDIHWRHVEDFE